MEKKKKLIIIFDQQRHQSRNGASFVKDCADYDGVILMRLPVLLLEMERDASFSNNGQIYTKYIITIIHLPKRNT